MISVTRILPFKKYIAKVILSWQNKNFKLSGDERIDMYIISSTYEFHHFTLLIYKDSQYYTGNLFRKNRNSKKNENGFCALTLISNRNKLEESLQYYSKRNYVFLKFKFRVASKSIYPVAKGSQNEAIKSFVKYTEPHFWDFSLNMINVLYRRLKKIDIAINVFYKIYNMHESDLAKISFKRLLYKHGLSLRENKFYSMGLPISNNKKTPLHLEDEYQRFGPQAFAHFWNYQVIKIYNKHWKDEISYRELAKEFGTSKSTIYRICHSDQAEEIVNTFWKIRNSKSPNEFIKIID